MEIVKGNLKIIETKGYIFEKEVKNYIIKKQTKNGVWRKIKTGNLGKYTLQETLENEIKRQIMKKIILTVLSIVAFILLIGEMETITFGTIIIKIISLIYLVILAKTNNYFYKGE